MADNQVTPPNANSKVCPKCLIEKPVSDLRFRKDGTIRGCLPCLALYQAKIRKENPGKQSEYNKKHYELHKEEISKRPKNWAINNPEKVKILNRINTNNYRKRRTQEQIDSDAEKRRIDYEKNQQRNIDAALLWAKNNPEQAAATAANRRAKQKFATPKWLNAGHHLEIYGYYQWCSIFPGHNVDHVYPLKSKYVSGMHVPWNLNILTKLENNRKKNKIPDPATIAPYIERPTLIIDADGFASLKFEE